MPASPQDSVTSLSDIQSNKSITAETVPNTVMAEQISHNVVNNTESTSGQPLVDVAANQATLASAEYGSFDQNIPETTTDALQTSQSINEHATDSNALTSHALLGSEAVDSVVEPSAGDTADSAARVLADPSELQTADKGTADPSQLVNGIHDPMSAGEGLAEDPNLPEGSLDVSLNSDTEGSRGDASELKKDEKHHTRSNSVKKPTTFSKVSVTKNFLAKSATATPTPPKPGEKPSPVSTPPLSLVAKPRLIAKTGASLRDVQKARLGTEGSSGPDASKVWNKNRPVAPPPPKQFTDEELRQQYGIHLTTRLQTDADGKESKWADIDDDEDDWAPDTVVWMDGTKSSLTPQDVLPIQKDQKPPSPQPQKPAEGVKPVLMVKKQTELGPTKTILKPGASAAAIQAKQTESPSGTPTEKPSLKTKSPAPAPAKSPWATLPPVDKISPVNPPVQQPQPAPFVSQDARAYEQAPPPQPAREIAADTFDRSWREGERGTRELFNSANGRYEPVNEARRSSVKPDSSMRKPSVLQRPSQSAATPAEPSAAFQTRTTSQSDGSWGRRRGSSVSQGSIPPARRMSISKGPEISPAPERRTSTVVGHDIRTSPRLSRTEPAQPIFPQQSAWQQQMPPPPAEEAVEEEDPVKVQERVMREKRELAKKRRQEAEERLEAEKQERLKARLAQLEGAGKSRREREAEAAAAAVAATPSSEVAPDSAIPASTAVEPPVQPTKPTEMATIAAPSLEAQPLTPAPENVLTKQASPEEMLPSPLPAKPQPSRLPDRPISSTDQNQRQQPRPHLSPRANARAPFQQQQSAYLPSTSSYSSPGDRKPQPFGRSPLPNNDTFATPWPTTAPNGNVWGTSGIGNGTFESSNVFAPMPMSQQNSVLPPPPGMSRPSPSNRISPQSLAQESRSPSLQQQPIVESQRGFAPPGFEARPDPFASQARGNGTSPAPGIGRPAHAPGPIAPPSRSQQQPAQQRDGAVAAWRAAADRLPGQYQVDANAAERKQQDAALIAPRDDTINETFKQTTTSQGRLGGPRRFDKTEYTIHDAQGSRSVQSLSPAPPNAQTQPSGPFSTVSPLQQGPWKQPTENTVRIPDGSLNPAHGGQPVQQPPIAPPAISHAPSPGAQGNVNFPASPLPPTLGSKDQSPPPPELSSHPVNSGDASHPHVKLPPGKPIVKLPPATSPVVPSPIQPSMAPQNSVMMPQRHIPNWGPPGSARPIVMNEDWQRRFNGLFNRTPIQTETPPSPPKTPPKLQSPAPAVTAFSRTLMDEVPTTTGATVSLPQAKRAVSAFGFTIDDRDDVISKPAIEQMFTEELSFGSSPKISVPHSPGYEDQVYDPLPRNMFGGASHTKHTDTVGARSIMEFDVLEVHPKHKPVLYVTLPQLSLRKVVRKDHDNRKSGGTSGFHQERKISGFRKGKGKEGWLNTVTTNGTPSPTSRKSSNQSGSTPAPASSAAASSPAAEAGKRNSSWAKPPKGPRHRPAAVKSN